MIANLHLLSGLPLSAPFLELKDSCLDLAKALHESISKLSNGALDRIGTACQRLEAAAKEADKAEVVEAYNNISRQGCRLGSLIIASGFATPEDLQMALECQKDKSLGHIEIGKMLVSWKFLTNNELNYLLTLQTILAMEPQNPQRLALQLRELGLLSDQEVTLALSQAADDQEQFFAAIAKNGWLTQSTLGLLHSK